MPLAVNDNGSPPSRSAMQSLLSGIRVLDFGRYVAGPMCSMMLGDLGADVIRVERIGGGEDRYLLPVGAEDGAGALYLQLNRNKRGLTLDPTTAKGYEVIRRLVTRSDVVVANLPDAVLATMRLDFESLRAIRQDVILAKASAYGSTGPCSNKLGFDGTGQAMCGAMYLSGTGDEPMRSFTSWVDHGTGVSLAFGVLAALLHRTRTGEGQVVEASLLGTALAFNADVLIEQQLTGINRHATGNRSQKGAPSDIFRTRDGKWILVQVMGPAMFKRWTALMGDQSWLDDPRFADDMARARNARELSQRMATWCAERTAADIATTLQAAGIPCAPVHSPAEALNDTHIQSGAFLSNVTYAGVDRSIPLIASPVRFSAIESTVRQAPPTVGEHTAAILRELGFGNAEIDELRAEQVV